MHITHPVVMACILHRVAYWVGYGAPLPTFASIRRLSLAGRPGNRWQPWASCSYTHVPLSPSTITWYRSRVTRRYCTPFHPASLQPVLQKEIDALSAKLSADKDYAELQKLQHQNTQLRINCDKAKKVQWFVCCQLLHWIWVTQLSNFSLRPKVWSET